MAGVSSEWVWPAALQGLAADFERELLDTVPDPDAPSPEQVRRIELWRRLVLLVERVAVGGPTGVGGDAAVFRHRDLAGARRAPSGHTDGIDPVCRFGLSASSPVGGGDPATGDGAESLPVPSIPAVDPLLSLVGSPLFAGVAL